MKKRTTITIVSFLALAALIGGGVWQWKKAENAKVVEQNTQQEQIKKTVEQGQANQKEQIAADTSNWKIYKNDKYEFEIKYPNNFTFAFQNKFDQSGSANMLFFDDKIGNEIIKSKNPLLSLIEKKVMFIRFDINGNNFVGDENFDIKKYLTPGVSEPGGKIFANERIIVWDDVKSVDGKTDIHFFTKEAEDAQKTRTMGAVWISRGKLFVVEPKKGTENEASEIFRKIALTFSQK